MDCKGVICGHHCENCGFNPEEKERRLREGHFEKIRVYHELHNDYGRIVHVVKGICKTLVFKKKGANT